MVHDETGNINTVAWTVYGKIAGIAKKDGTTVAYTYDASGNRISKTANGLQTWYVRDATGNVMATYIKGDAAVNGGDLSQTEVDLYGSSRLGVLNAAVNCTNNGNGPAALVGSWDATLNRGQKLFELTNHLGNVLATVTDRLLPVPDASGILVDYNLADVASANDYYPFGMVMPGRSYSAGSQYRYGFNGKENEKDISEGAVAFEARINDVRLGGRWFSIDKAVKPAFSPYQFAKNNPINFLDPDGNDEIHFYYYTQNWLGGNGKAFTSITISTEIVQNGDRNHTFFVHKEGIGNNVVQLHPFENGTNLPNQESFSALQNGLPLAPVTKYLFGLAKNYTDDYEYLGRLLQVDPTVLNYYKDDHQWFGRLMAQRHKLQQRSLQKS